MSGKPAAGSLLSEVVGAADMTPLSFQQLFAPEGGRAIRGYGFFDRPGINRNQTESHPQPAHSPVSSTIRPAQRRTR
jgi:hypothetical protein